MGGGLVRICKYGKPNLKNKVVKTRRKSLLGSQDLITGKNLTRKRKTWKGKVV